VLGKKAGADSPYPGENRHFFQENAMSGDLQHLIERIRNEGVKAAEAEAEEIVAAARNRAGAIVREAEDQARALLAKAEEDAKVFTERSRTTLVQAARDLLLSVSQGVENIMSELVAEAAREALDTDCVKRMLRNLTENCDLVEGKVDMSVLVSPEQEKELVHFFAELYKQRLAKGIELHASGDILRGFRIAYKNEAVFLDFTEEAVAEAMSSLLRPHLAEIVSHALTIREGVEKARRTIGFDAGEAAAKAADANASSESADKADQTGEDTA